MFSSVQRAQHFDASVEPSRAAPSFFSIRYTPSPGSAFARFSRSWFGRGNGGATLKAFSVFGPAGGPPASAIQMQDRFFGLHAPFFAPAPLRTGARLEDVRAHLQSFVSNRKPIETGPLQLSRSGRTLVLEPARHRPELDWLALQCFNAFDTYAERLEPIEQEQPHLNPHQRLLLKSFGQPNVMSEYRFSLTLTGPLEEDQIERISNALHPLIAGLCADGLCIDALSLIGEGREPDSVRPSGTDPKKPSRLLGRYSLAE